jgi:hypothetical protein
MMVERRAAEPGTTKIPFNGGAAHQNPFGVTARRFVRKGLSPDPARETLSVLLDTK